MRTPVVTAQPRLTVDPNSFSRLHPEWHRVLMRDATWVPSVGDEVVAVQDELEGPDYVSTAIVKRVDHDAGLIYVQVDWDGFEDETVAWRSSAAQGAQVEYILARAGSARRRDWRPRSGGNFGSVPQPRRLVLSSR